MRRSDAEFDLPDLYETTISEIQRGLESGRFKSTHLVKVLCPSLSFASYNITFVGILGEN